MANSASIQSRSTEKASLAGTFAYRAKRPLKSDPSQTVCIAEDVIEGEMRAFGEAVLLPLLGKHNALIRAHNIERDEGSRSAPTMPTGTYQFAREIMRQMPIGAGLAFGTDSQK